MFERFTDRARKVMALANEEAKRINHEYVGTEHILAGLVHEGTGVGANVLKNLGIDLRNVRREIERLEKIGPEPPKLGKLPQTPRAKQVLEHAVAEARSLGHNYVGTEHLLLGLLCARDGVAAQVLENLGLRLDAVRKEIVDLLGMATDPGGPSSPSPLSADSTQPSISPRGAVVSADLPADLLFAKPHAAHPLVRTYLSVLRRMLEEKLPPARDAKAQEWTDQYNRYIDDCRSDGIRHLREFCGRLGS